MSGVAAIERVPPAYPPTCAPTFAPTFAFGPLYPFPSRFATVGRTGAGASQGHRMHYVDEGNGPVVVCLHGNPTWGFQFRNLIASLRQDFRVIVPDHVGCGLSDQPKDVYFTAADRIAHLEELLEQLGSSGFHS